MSNSGSIVSTPLLWRAYPVSWEWSALEAEEAGVVLLNLLTNLSMVEYRVGGERGKGGRYA